MEFTHRSYEKGQTIAAIATPPGEGGIAIIRISGDKAIDVAEKIFDGPVRTFKTHTVHFGKILDSAGIVIDEGLVIVMRAPRSFTGEDTVEVHCHGGTLLTRKVLEAALSAGARAALPGEFSFKAFQNGKIDLTKAEAIQEVIASKSELACNAAKNQLQGTLHKKIASFQKRLTDIAAILEAWVDFPEEGLEFASEEEMIQDLSDLISEMEQLHRTFHEGKLLQTGFTISLIGPPNVGKSSLMNLLTGKECSIVTDIPGTTRDLLEKEIHLAGLHLHLIDTAGIRDTEEIVEKEGVKRSIHAAKEADLILLILDSGRPDVLPDLSLFPVEKTIAVWNKTDLPFSPLPNLPFTYVKEVSAKEEIGIENLKEAIYHFIWNGNPPSKDEVVLTNGRHFQALGFSIQILNNLKEGFINHHSPELLTSDTREALKELGTIIGVNVSEEVLSAIFSKFCVGK